MHQYFGHHVLEVCIFLYSKSHAFCKNKRALELICTLMTSRCCGFGVLLTDELIVVFIKTPLPWLLESLYLSVSLTKSNTKKWKPKNY